MNPMDMEILGGLPTERFVGRFIKAKIPDQGFCRCKCLEALWGKLVVEIKVKGNRRHHQVPLADCNPNWTENQDLMAEAENAQADPIALASLVAEIEQRKHGFAKPRPIPPKSKPEPPPPPVISIAEPPPPEPEPEPVSQPEPPPVPSVLVRTAIRLEIAEGADFSWVDDYKLLQSSVAEMDEINHEKAVLEARERSNAEMMGLCLLELDRKGVKILNALNAVPPDDAYAKKQENKENFPPQIPREIQLPSREIQLPAGERDDYVAVNKQGTKFTRCGHAEIARRRALLTQVMQTIPPRIPHDVKTLSELAGLPYLSTIGKLALDIANTMPKKISYRWCNETHPQKRVFTRIA